MDARTWSYGGREWPYDDETSAEIDARVEAAKYADGGSPSDLERYETEVFAPTLVRSSRLFQGPQFPGWDYDEVSDPEDDGSWIDCDHDPVIDNEEPSLFTCRHCGVKSQRFLDLNGVTA